MRILAIFLLLPLSAAADPVPAAVKARAATVDCAPGASCSPSVGLLSFTSPAEASQCTASLVAPDIIATNGHCVPEDLRQAGASCAGRVWMNFAKSANPDYETQAECDSVLFVEKPKTAAVSTSPDYAFYRLKRASRRPFLRISRAGFGDGEEISFERVNPVKAEGKIYGQQETLTCHTIQHSILAKDFTSKLGSVALVADCAPMFGNSGSPLVGRDGTIRGVIHAKSGSTEQTMKVKSLKLPDGLAPHGFGTNYACRNLPAELGAPAMPAACGGPFAANESFEKLSRESDAAPQKLTAPALKALKLNEETCDYARDFPLYRPYTVKFRPVCVRAELAGASLEVKSGPLNFRMAGTLDRYGRLREIHLESDVSSEAGFLLTREADGGYRMDTAGQTLALPACGAGQ